MTQASLSPDLHDALGAPPSGPDAVRPGIPSESALWMIALTSSSLVLAAVLLLGLLSRSVVRDASLGGFVSGVGIVIAALGVGGVSYALVTARRAGYIDSTASPAATTAVPAGMHVVPAVPPDLGRRKRRQLEAERAERNRQAKAIATATAVTATPRSRPAAPGRQAARPVAPPRSTPRPSQRHAARRTMGRAVQPASGPAARPVAARPAPVHAMRPAPANQAPVQPSSATPRPVARPAITMPRQQMRQPRPAAWPHRAPVVRMAPPPMRTRTHVATFQVNAANVRAAHPVRSR